VGSPLVKRPERKPTFTKIFRWRLPAGQSQAPASVEIAGTFTNWQRVSLTREGGTGAWQIALHEIASHRTHHYMLLADGKPVYDENCDGVAVPIGPLEKQYALTTDKGPRVFMLFAQTK